MKTDSVLFKNCMLRIPGSINSKNGQPVKLLNRWDGYKPRINPLLQDFYVHLCGQRIKELTNRQSQSTTTPRHLRDDEDGSYYQSISRYLSFKKRR
ncbi:MAG TPA: hypothetical protein VIX38_04895 [Nitrososphaeraceae archaeon]